jgi:hypothetical protein
MSRAGARFLFTATVALLMASGCTGDGTSSPNEPCSDLIDAITAAPSPPRAASSGGIYIGRGDTFFMGTEGRRWGENVEYYGGSFHMKVGIYTLDSHPPKVSVLRSDGRATGAAEFAPTSEGLPGPLPTGLSFPTAGCWKVEARGTTGFASIEVNVQASNPSSAS